MAPKFGTSGLRGLVTELTPALIGDHVRAFLHACPTGPGVHLGRDLRASSPAIAAVVAETLTRAGVAVTDCGAVPTPALALAAMARGEAAVMVTGSHIPADRNGLKFYLPGGEITKADEAAILAALGRPPADAARPGRLTTECDCVTAYVARYAAALGAGALAGLRIGVYQHSSVARDILIDTVRALGGTPVPLARSDSFIPVDTEAVDPATQGLLRGWVTEQGLDAVISTDGDGDRPMLADATGALVPGDVLGTLTARYLGATVLCTPVSSNGMIDAMPDFSRILRTRIGSPFVIAAMETVLRENPAAKVAGFEPNGGFLLGFSARLGTGDLAPLMTRDSLLPLLAPLAMVRENRQPLAALAAALPPRFTAADRQTGIASDKAAALLAQLMQDATARAVFFADMGDETTLDLTDGLRVGFAGGDIVHLRPSGNAPEFRCYAESDSAARAQDLVGQYLARVAPLLGPGRDG